MLKVVQKVGETLVSGLLYPIGNIPGVVEYQKDIPTRPLGGFGPLCAFKDEESLKKYCKIDPEDQKMQVWECDIVPSKHDDVWLFVDNSRGAFNSNCLNQSNHEPFYRHISTLPEGTVLADEVTLRRKVELSKTSSKK